MRKTHEKEKREKITFTEDMVNHFVKDFSKQGFNLDKFLVSKGAMKKSSVGNSAPFSVVQLATTQAQDRYCRAFIQNTPYYSLEISLNRGFWEVPINFWNEIYAHSQWHIDREVDKIMTLEAMEMGVSIEERRQQIIKGMRIKTTA